MNYIQTTLGLYQKHLYCEKELVFCKKVFERYGIDTGLHNAAKHTLETLQAKSLESTHLSPTNTTPKESSKAHSKEAAPLSPQSLPKNIAK